MWAIFVFLDKNIKNIDYAQSLLDGALYFELFTSLLLIVSPFFITKLRYSSFNKKRFFISLSISLVLLVVVSVFWGYLMTWGLGKLTETL